MSGKKVEKEVEEEEKKGRRGGGEREEELFFPLSSGMRKRPHIFI